MKMKIKKFIASFMCFTYMALVVCPGPVYAAKVKWTWDVLEYIPKYMSVDSKVGIITVTVDTKKLGTDDGGDLKAVYKKVDRQMEQLQQNLDLILKELDKQLPKMKTSKGRKKTRKISVNLMNKEIEAAKEKLGKTILLKAGQGERDKVKKKDSVYGEDAINLRHKKMRQTTFAIAAITAGGLGAATMVTGVVALAGTWETVIGGVAGIILIVIGAIEALAGIGLAIAGYVVDVNERKKLYNEEMKHYLANTKDISLSLNDLKSYFNDKKAEIKAANARLESEPRNARFKTEADTFAKEARRLYRMYVKARNLNIKKYNAVMKQAQNYKAQHGKLIVKMNQWDKVRTTKILPNLTRSLNKIKGIEEKLDEWKKTDWDALPKKKKRQEKKLHAKFTKQLKKENAKLGKAYKKFAIQRDKMQRTRMREIPASEKRLIEIRKKQKAMMAVNNELETLRGRMAQILDDNRISDKELSIIKAITKVDGKLNKYKNLLASPV